ALLFNRAVDDLDAWCDDVEGHLASEDHGRDLTSVKKLLKKHQRLETDITNHLGAIKKVEAMARGFDAAGHFMNDDIQARAKTIIDRYYSLREPAQIRRENLEDAKLLQQFARDVEEEVSWIEEKLPLARSPQTAATASPPSPTCRRST
ncbi:PREDICTED: spectrin alpha chain, non-erythrocytic 1-like, partial [Priapulus caudatus]|uniref:Spectrin alpha chain, non-erythrocytic 1-like n=1 Tax=Priapulus caudatus TaxID=37621 RepID=A0ABM1F6Y1_PRICU